LCLDHESPSCTRTVAREICDNQEATWHVKLIYQSRPLSTRNHQSQVITIQPETQISLAQLTKL
jgi:hypothetical protein